MDELKGTIVLDDTAYKTKLTKKFAMRKPYKPDTNKEVRAFIPGGIREVFVKKGDKIRQGDILLTLEAMKMKNRIFSPMDGIVKSVNVSVGEVVPKNALLVEIE
jgi:biotin carboxyl carrier protein